MSGTFDLFQGKSLFFNNLLQIKEIQRILWSDILESLGDIYHKYYKWFMQGMVTWSKAVTVFKVAPYSFSSARALISKISRWRKLSNSTPKSRTGSRSKMPTNMASKLLKFVYRKCCVDGFRFQNICRLNRRPQLSLLDVKEKYTRHVGVSTNEDDFM